MKKILYILTTFSLILSSCNDLDVQDKANLPQSEALKDIAGFQSVLNSAYESVNDFGYYGQTMMIGPEILADNMELVQLTGRYELEYVNAVNSGINIWVNRYSAINECNIVINHVNDVPGDQVVKDRMQAEALFLRALFYHDLARVYGYEPGQEVGGFTSAVVLKTNATFGLSDVIDVPRATNEEIYEQIEEDLLAAIPVLAEVTQGTSAVRFANKDAARLLLARVYLYWGNNTQAAALAQQVITGTGSDLVASANYVNSFNDVANPFHPESVFESEILSADWNTVDGANNSLHSLLMNNSGGSQFIITASQELLDDIATEATDVRNNLFNTESLGQEFNKWRGAKGPVSFMENIPILRISEGYLIAAEALGPGAGDPFINALRDARGVTADVSATVDNVLRQRRMEFMAEGHRWFDLKRLGMDIPKPAASGETSLPYTDFKILPRIPQSEINLSDNLVQNPGYN